MPRSNLKRSAPIRTGLEPVLDEIRAVRRATFRDSGGTIKGYIELVQRRTEHILPATLSRTRRSSRGKAA